MTRHKLVCRCFFLFFNYRKIYYYSVIQIRISKIQNSIIIIVLEQIFNHKRTRSILSE